jgi:hypothetical protein
MVKDIGYHQIIRITVYMLVIVVSILFLFVHIYHVLVERGGVHFVRILVDLETFQSKLLRVMVL